MSSHTWTSFGGCDLEVQSLEGKRYWDIQAITWREDKGQAKGSLRINEVYQNLDCIPRIFLGYANEYGPQEHIIFEGVKFNPTSKGRTWTFTATKITRS